MTKKSMKKKLPAAILSATILASTAVGAVDRVTVGGVNYTCENRCEVYFTPYGPEVYDSEGGWWGYAYV